MRGPPEMTRRRRLLAGTILLLLLLLLIGSPSAADSDRDALLQFKASVASDPAGLLRLWSADGAVAAVHCSWPGVTCGADSRVVVLNISAKGGASPSPSCPGPGSFLRSCADPGRRMAGELSAALGSLAQLRVLALPFHAFSDGIPAGIWELENLEVLDLEGNGALSGPLPSVFPPRLRTLNLASNLMQGQIPISLSSCKALDTLDLSDNQLNGSIPGFLGALPNLRGLRLSLNRFSGAISDELGAGCRSLEYLDLSGNFLAGGIPRSLGNCSQLRALLLFSNLLDDIIPSDLGRLKKLQALDVSRNSLSGPVPPELGGCLELSVLVLSNPYNVMYVSKASTIVDTDDFNYYQGGIPGNIVALPKLRVLWAPRATLEGEVPGNWSSCESLEMVNLGENLLSGGIPEGLGQCRGLKHLNLSSNKLMGWIRGELPVPCMDVFDISENQLSGSIPAFSLKGCPSSRLPLDELAYAYSSFFAFKSNMGLPSSSFLSTADLMTYHNFGQNNFTGNLLSLPLAAEKFGKQFSYAFLADGNSLSGPMASSLFSKCAHIKGFIMDLSNNLLSGGIPGDIGVICTSLVVLSVAGNRITGVIPQSIGELNSLVYLDLSRNLLQCEIPASVEYLQHLQHLSVGHNFLNGSIPSGLGQLHSLQVLDLSSNLFSGEIPSSLANLTNLTTLLLVNNTLSGSIPPGFANSVSLAIFNVSFNNLSGAVPSNANTIRCDGILGNPLLQSCRALAAPSYDQQGQSESSQDYNGTVPMNSSNQASNSGFSSIEIASIASATAIVSVLLALIVLFIYTRKCAPKFTAQSAAGKEVTVFTDIGVRITFEMVVRATGSFNASNCIGSGGFGATYKAEIAPGVLVAIKRLSIGRFQGLQQFDAEIKTLGRLRHPNLVTLIGYHFSEPEMFLIYNYLPGGNLERFIQERSKRAVDWRTFHKIALDIARALAYLHDGCVPRILHRDVKPSNILLDNDYNAYLSDFGLARLLGNSETHATTGVAGTFGYVAPEYALTCRVSDKADVYSYGVVLMELISDKKALDPSFSPYGNGFKIVDWACMLLRQGRAREFFVGGLWDVGPHDDLVETLHLAVMCTVDSLSIRPTMKQVVQRLKQLQPHA